MLRFFTPSHPCGRLEYLLVHVALYAIMYFATSMLLGFSFDIDTQEWDYDANKLTMFLVIAILVFGVGLINVLRRLHDLQMGSGWAICHFLPLVNLLFHLYLLLASRVDQKTFAHYGDNPYNPDSWVPNPDPAKTGPSVTFQGQPLLLPGEEEQQNWPDVA